jgi:hypothetical protein
MWSSSVFWHPISQKLADRIISVLLKDGSWLKFYCSRRSYTNFLMFMFQNLFSVRRLHWQMLIFYDQFPFQPIIIIWTVCCIKSSWRSWCETWWRSRLYDPFWGSNKPGMIKFFSLAGFLHLNSVAWKHFSYILHGLTGYDQDQISHRWGTD